MNKINRNNYEIWFVDFKDGLLSHEQIQELNEFLNNHHDLKKEFELWCSEVDPFSYISVDSESKINDKPSIHFTPFSEINEDNYEQKFFEYFEGDLNEEESQDVQTFINLNPQLEKEFKLHESLKMLPEEQVLFHHKALLYKKSGLYVWRKAIVYTAAACLMLFIGYGLNNYNKTTVEMVESTPAKETPKPVLIKTDTVNTLLKDDFDIKVVSQESKKKSDVVVDDSKKNNSEINHEKMSEVEIKEFEIRNIAQLPKTNNHRITEEVVLVADLTPIEPIQDEAVESPSNQIRKINLNDIPGTIKQALADVADIEYKSEPIADGNKKMYFRIGSYSIERK